MKKETWSFIIVAGGTGSRLGGTPKQFRLLAGIPVWKWSAKIAEMLWEEGAADELLLVVPEDLAAEAERHCDLRIPIRLTAGGPTRSQSVMNGLNISCGSHVLVHDAARPFITAELCRRLMKSASEGGAAMPLIPIRDSIKMINSGEITSVDRTKYFKTQTPQAFEKYSLIEALKSYGTDGTDEAEAWIGSGRKITSTEGLESNFKITTKFDWEAAVSAAGGKIIRRTGHGFDVHKLVRGRRLVLGGIDIEGAEYGLLGHSDADLIIHTVMDAVLGAAGMPDIGTLFPSSDPEWKDYDSMEMLKRVLCMVRSEGWSIDWIDVTLRAQSPKLGHMIPMFIRNVASVTEEECGKINFNMKVKSGEGCGSVGRNECMTCDGVATLSKYEWDQG